MSQNARNVLAVMLILLLTVVSFTAGFFVNEFVDSQIATTVDSAGSRDLSLLWEAWSLAEGHFIGELPTDSEFSHGAIKGVFAELDDPYTIFVEPVAREQERQSLQGIFGGIGAYLRRDEEGGPVLLEPIPGNPAEAAGILLNDVLVAVDGVEITPEMTVSQVADLIKGEKGSAVILTVRQEGSETAVDIEIERGDILIPSVTQRMIDGEQGIGYIQLSRFSAESRNEIEESINILLDQGMEMLILDLRHNGGGLLDAAVEISDLFLDDGPILYQQSQAEGERVFEASGRTLLPDAPLVLLIDQGTASASEIVAGALQDRGRATIIGSPSYGKGSVQLVFDLSDGSSVHVTSARWYTPDRQPIDQNGVVPDIPVELTEEAINNGIDQVLNQAIDFLNNGR